MTDEKTLPFSGCATALVTPMRAGGIDYKALEKLIEFQISSGVSAIVACGTTGEAPTLCAEEKRRVIKFCVDTAGGRIPVIAGCGSPSSAVAAEYSKTAEDAGASAILCVTPYYNKATDYGAYLHYKTVAGAVKLPVIAYNVPSRTGMSLGEDALTYIAEIPNVCAVKEASGDMTYVGKIASKYREKLSVYSGCDALIAPVYSLGGRGVISVVSNVIPKETVKLCSLCESGYLHDAAEYQLGIMPLITELFSEINPIPVKAALSMMGICTPEMRLPLCRMNKAKEEKLRNTLRSFGIGTFIR